MDESVATWPATKLADAIRSERAHEPRAARAVSRPHRAPRAADVNAVVTLDVDRARAAAAGGRRSADARRRRRAAARPPGHDQGRDRDRRHPLDRRRDRSSRTTCPTAGCARRRPPEGRGAIVFGKTNLPRVVGRPADASTSSSARRTTRGRSIACRAGRRAARRPRSRAGSRASSSAPTSADRCASRRTSAASTASSRATASCSQRGYLDHVGGGTTDADINVFGPIARSADDLELLLVGAGRPGARTRGRVAARRSRRRRRHALGDFRVGVWFDDPTCRVESEYGAMLSAAADTLADAGAKVEDAHPAVDFAEQVGVFMHMITAAVSPSMTEDVGEAFAGSHLAWLKAEKQRGASVRSGRTGSTSTTCCCARSRRPRPSPTPRKATS